MSGQGLLSKAYDCGACSVAPTQYGFTEVEDEKLYECLEWEEGMGEWDQVIELFELKFLRFVGKLNLNVSLLNVYFRLAIIC